MIHRKLLVPYTPSQIFTLVDDIEQYKNFLPWCRESKVLSRTPDEVRATLVLAASGLQKAFTTHNRIQQDKMIEINLVDGPFRHLEGFWRFYPEAQNHCTIQFDLEFEFSNRLLSMAFAPVFHQVATTLIDAFAKRAQQLYGPQT